MHNYPDYDSALENATEKLNWSKPNWRHMVNEASPTQAQKKILSMPERMSKKRKAILKKQSKTT